MSIQVAPSSTPILDLESPLPRRGRLRWRHLFVAIGIFTIGVLSFAVAFFALGDEPVGAGFVNVLRKEVAALIDASVPENSLAFLVFYLGASLMILTSHELAHVVAGRIVGFHFETVRVGPFALVKSAKGLKFKLQGRHGLDGMAAMRIDRLGRLRRRLGIYIAAGPVANVLAVPCVWLFFVSQALDKWQHSVGKFLLFWAALSVVIAIVNLIPYQRENGMFTDGARLLSLVRSGAKARRWLSLLALKMESDAGVRPKHLKRTWIVHSCAIADQSRDALRAFWFAYVAHLDRGESDEAAGNLEKCLERFRIASPEFQKLILTEAAIFQAWYREDEEKAKTWAQALAGPAGPPLNQLRLAICMHWVARQYEQATSAWEEGRKQVERLPASPQKDSMRESWLEWKTQIDRKRKDREPIPGLSQSIG